LALAAVLITILAVWYTYRPIDPPQAIWQGVVAEAEAGDYRISTTEELAGRYHQQLRFQSALVGPPVRDL
jgi:hypothetical protein